VARIVDLNRFHVVLVVDPAEHSEIRGLVSPTSIVDKFAARVNLGSPTFADLINEMSRAPNRFFSNVRGGEANTFLVRQGQALHGP
jgi:hypothetical protein